MSASKNKTTVVVEGSSVRGASNSFKIDNGAGYGLSPTNETDPQETVTLCCLWTTVGRHS